MVALTRHKAHEAMQLVKLLAQQSRDPDRKVATILLDGTLHHILSTGFNGMCRGCDETTQRWERPMKYKYVVHAEANAIANAARSSVSVDNAICVCTLYPCVECSKLLIQSGIKSLVTTAPDFNDPKWGDDFRISREILGEAGVDVILMECGTCEALQQQCSSTYS